MRRRLGVLGLALLATLLPQGARAQDLAQRVAEVQGRVLFVFATREGVEVCPHGVWMGRGSYPRGPGDERDACAKGWATLVMNVRDGVVASLALASESAEGVDLGSVPAPEAADFLLSLPGRVERDVALAAFLPAAAANAATGARLLEIMRDPRLDPSVRERAMFWAARQAAGGSAAQLADLAADASADAQVRRSAVQALSRMADELALDRLIEIARTSKEAGIREIALRRIARSEDPRAVRFFEDVLLRR